MFRYKALDRMDADRKLLLFQVLFMIPYRNLVYMYSVHWIKVMKRIVGLIQPFSECSIQRMGTFSFSEYSSHYEINLIINLGPPFYWAILNFVLISCSITFVKFR